MKVSNPNRFVLFILLWATLIGSPAMSAVNPLETQALQSMTFEDYTQGQVFIATVMTLQDFSYTVTQSDINAGFILANKGADSVSILITQKGENSVNIRTSKSINPRDMIFYQTFYTQVRQNLFTADTL